MIYKNIGQLLYRFPFNLSYCPISLPLDLSYASLVEISEKCSCVPFFASYILISLVTEDVFFHHFLRSARLLCYKMYSFLLCN